MLYNIKEHTISLILNKGDCFHNLRCCPCIFKTLNNSHYCDPSDIYKLALKVRDNNYIIDDSFIFDNKI